MARPREFDVEDALAKAMGVFWQHGYEGASLPRLLTGMELSRGSFYKAYSDKKSLFLAALAHYEAEAVTPPVAHLTSDNEPDGIVRIMDVFDGVLETVRKGDRRGCLLCTASAGPTCDDPDIAGPVQAQLDRMQQGFRAALAKSPVHQDLPEAQLVQISVLLLTQYIGLRIMSRGHAPLKTIEQSVAALKTQMDTRAVP